MEWDFSLDGSIARIVFIVVMVFVVQFVAKKFLRRLIDKIVRSHHYKSKHDEKQREDTLESIFGTMIAVLLWVIAAFLILQELGFNIAALATGAGLVGIVVGFGAQSMIKDYVNGMFIILENQYRIGDVVEVGGRSGLVEEVTIRMTKLRDLDGSVYFVPNGEITTVKNMTLEYSGLVVNVSVDYDTDINKAKDVMNKVGQEMAEDPEWVDRIVEPVTYLRLDSFGDSGVNLLATGKTTPIEQWNVAGEYRTRLKKAFEHAHIEIPLPQRVMHQASKKSK